MALLIKNLPSTAGDIRDVGSIPESGRSPGGRQSNQLHCSCLENPMDRRAWQATVHRVTKTQTWLKWLSTHIQSTGIWQRREMFKLFGYVTTSTLNFSNCIPFIYPDSQTEEFNYTHITVDAYINATVFTYIWDGFYCMEESPPNIPNLKRLKYISSNIVNYI